MKALIFKEMSKMILKEEYREGKEDIIKLYRTDSFGSTSCDIENSKAYGYKVKDGKILVNERYGEKYESMYIRPHVASIEYLLEESKDGKLDGKYLEYYKSVKMGYVTIRDRDYENYQVKKDLEIQDVVYTHLITFDPETEKIEVTDISTYVSREKFLKELE